MNESNEFTNDNTGADSGLSAAAGSERLAENGTLKRHLQEVIRETEDFFEVAACTSGRVRIGFESGTFKRCSIKEAEVVLEILTEAIRHAKRYEK